MLFLLFAAAAAQAPPAAEPTSLNPHAVELFERDAVLNAWAVRTFDRNRDGWLTSYEAQPAVKTFKEMADTDRDGRVTVREFEDARSWVEARFGATAQSASAP
ncbi:hypothetical protein [Sphingomonas arenae]|uniref:hypothetical protein n=1 Tax=Sphingomonas arenae TaxID=2812555 RepID=UPI0019681726|nr:hypothetical protein [Sphingomonas arenae]